MPRTLGTLERIWTYPVKSLKGVAHASIAVQPDGLTGDRRTALYVANDGHARGGKTYRGKENNHLHLLTEPDEARRLGEAAGVDLEIRSGERYFDASPVSLIFDVWIAEVEAALGETLDPMRWRPNLFARAAGPIGEDDLIGAQLAIGDVLLRVVTWDRRCVTPTYDQKTGESNPEVLRFVAQARNNVMGVYCDVERPGTIGLGDALALT